jgi:hypothetical protein
MSSNYVDIDKYYNKTYIKLEEFGDRLFYIQGVSSEKVFGLDEDQTYFELLLGDEYPYTVNFILPHKAIFQHKDSVYMLQRIPARQYRRGLCSDNTQMMNVITGLRIDINFTTLKSFITKQPYLSFKQAFEYKGKAQHLTLTSRMSFNRRTGEIYMDFRIIAHYDRTKRSITLVNKNFAQEIMQHMMNYNETYTVTNL